ncbi:hypothetical protein BKI52_02880 [marine bacterium AO1-C]|nr:hypothetical protein BKI52_02880 [marine bacterium AO1-C]
MDLVQKYTTIENYLEGKLEGEELADFEQLMAADSELAQEVEEHRLLIENLERVRYREEMKAKMNALHTELFENEEEVKENKTTAKVRKLWHKYQSIVAIAASVTIIFLGNTFFNLKQVRSVEEKQSSNYLQLNRELKVVKRKQKNIEAKTKKLERDTKEAITAKVKSTGATALVISPTGFLVTNYHVVKDADSIYIETRRDSTVLRLKVKEVYSDEEKDLAILRVIDNNFTTFGQLPFTLRTEEANLAESVYTLAYPREDIVYGEGTISAQTGYRGNPNSYQISIPVNPGNSGAPVMDGKGNLVAVITGKDKKMEGATFAIKAKYLATMMDSATYNLEVTDSLRKPLVKPNINYLQYLPRPQQVRKLRKFVFVVKVYNSDKIF